MFRERKYSLYKITLAKFLMAVNKKHLIKTNRKKILKVQNLKFTFFFEKLFACVKMGGDAKCYKVCKNEKVGRYAVATKALKAGDVILTESPFAVGPKVGRYSPFVFFFC